MSPGNQRGERPESGNQADAGHQQAAAEWCCLQVTLITVDRRADEGNDVADAQRSAEGEHEPGEEILSEKHADSMPYSPPGGTSIPPQLAPR